MDRPLEPPVAFEQPGAEATSQEAASLMVRPSSALVARMGRRVQRWMPGLGRVRGGLRQWREGLWRHPLADELERSRRENEQLQQLLAELPEIFERKYQQRLEPLLEHQYRLLEDNALLMDQLRLLQGNPVPDMQELAAAGSQEAPAAPGATAGDSPVPAFLNDPMQESDASLESGASEPVSVHLEGTAPLADVRTLLHSPPWGVLTPSLVEVRQGGGATPPAAASARPSFEQLVSMASQQMQSAAVEEEDATGEPVAAAQPWRVDADVVVSPQPEPMEVEPAMSVVEVLPVVEAEGAPASEPEPAGESAAPAPEITAAAEAPQDPGTMEIAEETAEQSALPEDADPLELARARRLQAWRRSRQQGAG